MVIKTRRKKPVVSRDMSEEDGGYPSRASTIRVVKGIAVFYGLSFIPQIVELTTVIGVSATTRWLYLILVSFACLTPIAAVMLWMRLSTGRILALVLCVLQLLFRAFFVPMTEPYNAVVLVIMFGVVIVLLSDGVDRVFGKKGKDTGGEKEKPKGVSLKRRKPNK